MPAATLSPSRAPALGAPSPVEYPAPPIVDAPPAPPPPLPIPHEPTEEHILAAFRKYRLVPARGRIVLPSIGRSACALGALIVAHLGGWEPEAMLRAHASADLVPSIVPSVGYMVGLIKGFDGSTLSWSEARDDTKVRAYAVGQAVWSTLQDAAR